MEVPVCHSVSYRPTSSTGYSTEYMLIMKFYCPDGVQRDLDEKFLTEITEIMMRLICDREPIDTRHGGQLTCDFCYFCTLGSGFNSRNLI